MGLALAPARADRSATVMWCLNPEENFRTPVDWGSVWATLGEEVRETLAEELPAGQPVDRVPVQLELLWQVEARYAGQSHELIVTLAPLSSPAELASGFHRAHGQRYGYQDEQSCVEVVTARVVGRRDSSRQEVEQPRPALVHQGKSQTFWRGAWRQLPVFRVGSLERDGRERLNEVREQGLPAPLLLTADEFSAFVSPGWQVSPVPGGLWLSRGTSGNDQEEPPDG
jgi:N-methylhydantoinase A/oxoprolinase/acetone carboxylase beta subunit